MIPVIAFTAYMSCGNYLDLAMALTAMQYFWRLLSGLTNFPEAIQSYNEMQIGFDRIRNFLDLPETQAGLVSKKEDGEHALSIEGAYSWGKQIDLQQFEKFKVKTGEFVCVVGEVGAGKTSLLNALIGNMIYVP